MIRIVMIKFYLFIELLSNTRSCERVDIVSKVRAQSCRRRSAKLSSEDRTKIVRKHRQTAEEKVESYYQVLKERERQELELLARKALVCCCCYLCYSLKCLETYFQIA